MSNIEKSSSNKSSENNVMEITHNLTDTIIKTDPKSKQMIMKNYFSYSELKDMSKSDIICIFKNSHLITFISNIYLETQKRVFWYCCGNFEINFSSCKDVIFLPYEYKFILMDIFSELMKSNDFKIVFSDGIIKKGVIYKRIIVQKSYAFIPLDVYNYKITEYNIRGFCQIVEELGANKIDIDFSHTINDESITDIESSIEIKKIAGDLGFSISNKRDNENSSTYTLEYPDNNNLILNINKIMENLRDGKYLISLDEYNTNLELQYVINSRCRHFITNYSTNFKIKNNHEFNVDSIMSLKIPDISINNKLKYNKVLSDNILIETKVIFNNGYRSPNQLLKYSISPDEIGYNFIFNNVRKKYNILNNEWIIFIWRFINIYCYEKCKSNYDNDSDEYNNRIYTLNFLNIMRVLNKIKENFSLPEIVNILKNYFDINSQMVDLKNFFDILDNKTKSYDELGLFLIIENNKILKKKECLINILEFIISKEKSNEKLKELLHVYNQECYSQIYIKLKKIGLLNFNNWNSMEYLISLSNKYIIKEMINEEQFDDVFKRLYNNFKVGLGTFEFYTNILPFIENLLFHYWYKQEDLEIEDINIILKSISEESFRFNIVNTLDKLKLYIEKKITKYKQINILYNDINQLDPRLINNFNEYLIRRKHDENTFKNKKSFIFKKIDLVYGNDYSKIKLKNTKEELLAFLKRIICYNERLNIHKITLDKFGFNKIKINMLSGECNLVFNNLWKPFIFKYFNFHYPDIYSIIEEKYKDDPEYLKNYLKNNLENQDLNTIINYILEDIL